MICPALTKKNYMYIGYRDHNEISNALRESNLIYFYCPRENDRRDDRPNQRKRSI